MPAPDRPGDRQIINKVLDVPKGIIGHYTDLEIDALLDGLSGGTLQTVDLSAYATTAYVDGELTKVYDKAEVNTLLATIVSGGTIDLSGYATQQELADAIAGLATSGGTVDLSDYYTQEEVDTSLAGAGLAITQIQDSVSNANGKIAAIEAGKADKADTYTKKEVDDAREADKDFSIANDNILLASITSLQEIVSNLGTDIGTTADLSGYAKQQDNTQQLLSRTVVAQGYGFGDSAEPPVALNYADSGEGYGDRLIVNIGAAKEYLVYKSDLDELLPHVDTSQFSTTVTVAALDTRISSLESTRATTATATALDTRIKSLESKAAATSNINDASNAALKKSILDAVALMIAGGGRQPPADIDWTPCRNNAGIQARMIAGVIELRGVLTYSTGASGDSSFAALPASFPTPEITCFMPAASRVTAGSVAVAAFVRFTAASPTIGFDAATKVNEVYIAGIKVKAAY